MLLCFKSVASLWREINKMQKLDTFKTGFVFLIFLSLAFLYFFGEFLFYTPTIEPKIFSINDEQLDDSLKKSFQSVREPSSTAKGHVHEVAKGKKQCSKPVSKFVYVKIHKTGSTSMKNILWNFIAKNHWTKSKTAAFPAPYTGGYPGRFKCKFKLPTKASINLNHIRFDNEEMRNCFHPETRYITLIRKPLDTFRSAHNFFSSLAKMHPSCKGMPKASIERGETMNTTEFLSKAAVLLNPSVPFYFRFRNLQSHDLGIDPMLTDANKIESQIKKLDKNMDLVMILEHFSESLILLKDLLCMDWDVLDVTHMNARHYVRTTTMDTQEQNDFNQLYNVDIALYDHFNRTFWKRVDAYGRNRMARDLETLRKKRNKRSTWKITGNSSEVELDSRLEAEIENYMSKNSGSCVYPS